MHMSAWFVLCKRVKRMAAERDVSKTTISSSLHVLSPPFFVSNSQIYYLFSTHSWSIVNTNCYDCPFSDRMWFIVNPEIQRIFRYKTLSTIRPASHSLLFVPFTSETDILTNLVFRMEGGLPRLYVITISKSCKLLYRKIPFSLNACPCFSRDPLCCSLSFNNQW